MALRTPADENRRVGDLTLEELETIVEDRRRIEQARAFLEADNRRFHPITVEPPNGANARQRRRSKNLRDRFLLVIELGAGAILFYIIMSSLGTLQTLNDEVSQAIHAQQEIQSLRPIEQTTSGSGQEAKSVELPGSSFSVGNLGELPGSSSPPEDLPAALGVSVENPPSLPPSTVGPESPTRIVIPALGIDWPIVPGDGWEELKRGVGHHAGSANPGERGNMILAGHDDVFGEVFKDLEQLKSGDQVTIYASGHSYRYEVRAKRIVPPSELDVLNPTREAVATLITCYPYRIDTMRLVVIAQLVE